MGYLQEEAKLASLRVWIRRQRPNSFPTTCEESKIPRKLHNLSLTRTCRAIVQPPVRDSSGFDKARVVTRVALQKTCIPSFLPIDLSIQRFEEFQWQKASNNQTDNAFKRIVIKKNYLTNLMERREEFVWSTFHRSFLHPLEAILREKSVGNFIRNGK